MPKKSTITSSIKSLLGEGLGYKDVKRSLISEVKRGLVAPIDERVNTQRAFELRRQGMTWENIAKDQHLRKSNIEAATKFHYPFLVERKRTSKVLQTIQQRTMVHYGFGTADEYATFMDETY